MLASSNCVCSRSFLSSAASGSSSSRSFGPLHERARKRHALLLAAGELLRLAARERPELHHREHLGDPLADLRRRQALLLQAVGDVLLDGHVREQRIGLEHQVDRALVGRHVGHVGAVDQDSPAGRVLEAREHPQQRRLAAAGAAEDREQFALLDLERNVVDGGDVAVALGDALDADQRLGLRVAHKPVFTRDQSRERSRSTIGSRMRPLYRDSRTASGGNTAGSLRISGGSSGIAARFGVA